MSGITTPNLGLFNTNMQTDGDDFFNFDRDLNNNNNIIDTAIGKLSTLTTEQKTSLVAAINELVAGKASINLNNLSSTGQAILDKKVEIEALLQSNGYAKFTWKENNQISNLLFQWGGCYTQTSNSYADISFPVSFPNSCYNVFAIRNVNSNYYNAYSVCFQENSKTKNGIRLHSSLITNYWYIAIGN